MRGGEAARCEGRGESLACNMTSVVQPALQDDVLEGGRLDTCCTLHSPAANPPRDSVPDSPPILCLEPHTLPTLSPHLAPCN